MEPIRRVCFCPHCGNYAPQRHIHTQLHRGKGYFLDGSLADDDLPCAYFIVACETCGQILLYHAFIDVPQDKDFHLASLVWPDPGTLDSAVPASVAQSYAEAARIKNLAPNAFAVQIRRALEALCDDRRAKRGLLQRRLEDLASKGEIPPILAEMTEVLRLLGNIGAHAADQTVKPGYVRAIDDFFRAVVQYVYVAPSWLAEFRQQPSSLQSGHNGSEDG